MKNSMTRRTELESRARKLASTGTHVRYIARLKKCMVYFPHSFLIHSFFALLITLIIILMTCSITFYSTFHYLFFFQIVIFGFHVHIPS